MQRIEKIIQVKCETTRSVGTIRTAFASKLAPTGRQCDQQKTSALEQASSRLKPVPLTDRTHP